MKRPTRNTLFACLCLALSICYPFRAEADGPAQDFDLACAITSAAEIVAALSGTDQRQFAFQIHWFYLGRLSGRDDGTYWYAVVQGKLALLKEKARNPVFYGECLVFATKQIS